jgi:hypothetical protein
MKVTLLPLYLLVSSLGAGLPLSAESPPASTTNVPAATIHMEDFQFSPEASDLLKDIRSKSVELTKTGAVLESLLWHGYSHYTHAANLSSMKSQINDIGGVLERLQAIRGETAPWQQNALDSILPTALTMAESTTAAIQHLKDNQRYLWAPSYASHLRSIADNASKLRSSVDLYLDLASTEAKLESVRARIGQAGS